MTKRPSQTQETHRMSPTDRTAPGIPRDAICPRTCDQKPRRHTKIIIAPDPTTSRDRLFLPARQSKPTVATTRSTLSQ